MDGMIESCKWLRKEEGVNVTGNFRNKEFWDIIYLNQEVWEKM